MDGIKVPLPFNPLWINPWWPDRWVPPEKREGRFNWWILVGAVLVLVVASKK